MWRREAEGLPFADRADAGTRLAAALAPFREESPLVLGIPRGGVPVAAEVARALGAELDVVVARKLRVPWQPELAMGAVTADGGCYLNTDLIRYLGVTPEQIDGAAAGEREEASRREEKFRAGRPAAAVEGRTVLVVDDGLATGATMIAAVRSLRRHRPARLVVAVPVGSREACEALRQEADEVVCLHTPEPFGAVGAFYLRFEQVEDAEVACLLAAHAGAAVEPAASSTT